MAPFHPLDPLNAGELASAAEACRAHASKLGLPSLRFNTITLLEPPKQELLAFARGAGAAGAEAPPRRAFCILQTPGTVEATVLLEEQGPVVSSWSQVEGVQPLATPDDCFDAEAIAKGDAGLQALLLEKYGITDLALVACDPWSGEAFNPTA